MRTLRRWTASVASSFDWMVSQVENHEALVNAAIKDVHEAGAKAQVQLKRMRQDGLNMRKRLTELRFSVDQWTERARSVGSVDEQKAIECLRRQKRALKEIQELEQQEREHAKIEKQLTQDLNLIDDRLVRLKQQRNVMRTRQWRAEALKSLQAEDGQVITEIDDIFERWENKVAEYECASDLNRQGNEDDLAEQFSSQEEQAELKATLDALLKNKIEPAESHD